MDVYKKLGEHLIPSIGSSSLSLWKWPPTGGFFSCLEPVMIEISKQVCGFLDPPGIMETIGYQSINLEMLNLVLYLLQLIFQIVHSISISSHEFLMGLVEPRMLGTENKWLPYWYCKHMFFTTSP